MPTSKTTAIVVLLALSTAAIGCMPQQQAPPPVASASLAPAASASPPPPTVASAPPHPRGTEERPRERDRHVYRFDFVLTSNEGAAAPSSTSFTLNLEDGQKGELLVGKNVPISPAPAAAPPGAPAGMGGFAAPRQDVGTKVLASFRSQGDDVLLEVSLEMSAFDPPSTIRKVVARGNALAAVGKPALVTTLEDDHKRYQLSVTSTKLR